MKHAGLPGCTTTMYLRKPVEGDNNITYSFEYDDPGRLKKETANILGRSFISETGYNAISQVNHIKISCNRIHWCERNCQYLYC